MMGYGIIVYATISFLLRARNQFHLSLNFNLMTCHHSLFSLCFSVVLLDN